ncbi:SLC13 family permease [Corallococcus interemptor]|uniref:SLC13 family permease n=1 Tax=Corallococcus interemptor TaxID=2316720 RepID=UPI003D041CE4
MEMPPLTPQLVATLGICIGALLLFLWNRLAFEVVGLVVLAALVLCGVLPIEQALSGFSNEAPLTVAGVLILATALERTGAVDMIARAFTRLGAGSELKLMTALIALTIPASAFLNNTAVVAVLMPVVLNAARQQRIAPSRLLIPLSFSSQLGGTLTLIGSSTNLLVSGVLLELGQPGFGFFQMTAPAALMMAGGVVYLMTFGRRLLPDRGLPEDEFHVPFQELESALVVEPHSAFAGATFQQVRDAGFEALKLKAIRRASHEGPLGESDPLRPRDLLIVEGPSDALKRADRIGGLHFATPRDDRDSPGRGELMVMEAVVTPRSRLIGHKLRDVGRLAGSDAVILAVQRHGMHPGVPTAERALQPGDLVLVEGTRRELIGMQRARLLLLATRVILPRKQGRWWLATGILVAVVLLTALGVMSMPLAVLLGVIAMAVTGCIDPADTYERVDWGVIILLGSLVPLGVAMQQTGAANLLAALVIRATSNFGPYVVLGALYLLTSVLTEFISNNAAAVVLTPVAVAVANALGASPVPFAMAVMIAASNSFMTPVGYQTNTFVYGPGGYRFTDFARVGAILNLLLVVLAVLVLPLFFPF